jgi:hypothetical protein
MRTVSTAAVLALLHVTTIVAQEPNTENFGRFRALIMERMARSAVRIGLTDHGTPLDGRLSQVFGMPGEIRVIKAAELVFPDEHRLTLTFSTNSTEVIVTEVKKTSDGTLLLTAFHTDLTLILRGSASGADVQSLNLVPTDMHTLSAFREVLRTWDRHLPQMLEPQVHK